MVSRRALTERFVDGGMFVETEYCLESKLYSFKNLCEERARPDVSFRGLGNK